LDATFSCLVDSLKGGAFLERLSDKLAVDVGIVHQFSRGYFNVGSSMKRHYHSFEFSQILLLFFYLKHARLVRKIHD